MKSRKTNGLRRGITIISLFLLFFALITVINPGIEKIQAEKAFSEYSKNPRYTYISNDFKKLLIIDKDLDLDEEDISYWDIDGKITLTISQDSINKDYEIKLAGDMLDNYDMLYALYC